MDKFIFALQLFANPNTNVTTDGSQMGDTHSVQPTMKTFYKTSLLENARNEHFFNQFGQKQPLPKNNGKKVEWRKFDTFAKALTPLTEGVTPDGNSVNITKIEKQIDQYGDYTTVSDRLELEAVDPVIVAVTEEHGAQAGDTLDTVTRNEVVSGTNVIFAGSGNYYRADLASTDVITATLINQAATLLKKMHAPTINGDYLAIIHPSVSFDLRESAGWLDVHKYAEPTEIFNGEIGKLHGVRFIEDSEQKIWKAPGLTAAADNLTVKTNVSADDDVDVKEAITADEATALVGRMVRIGTGTYEIASATAGAAGSAAIKLTENITCSANDVIYPGEGAKQNAAVYATTVFGKDAYGIIEPSAESLEVIVKQRGSAGTSDPLDQRSTIGWKASHAAQILYQERLVRIESCSSYSFTDDAN